MRRILLTGADGQVGWELQRTLAPLGQVSAFDRTGLDLADLDRLRTAIREMKPELIVNAAAYTAVDRAESEEALARRINAEAPRVMAEEADRLGAWFIHYSTDYVFDGTKSGPYVEDDSPNPLNAYGRTKLAGERAIVAAAARHVVFRTSWIYANRGKNFLLTMLRLGQEQDELRIVADQRGAPTWARLIAEATSISAAHLLERKSSDFSQAGVYHLTCGGDASWYDFACAIFAQSRTGRKPVIVPIPSSQYPTRAARPMNSVLSNRLLWDRFRLALPDWRHALMLCLG